MASSDLKLIYLVEGTQEKLSVSVSCNVEADILKRLIFEKACKELVRYREDIILLKINVDLEDAGVYLPLLRFNKENEGVEEIHPEQILSEVWKEPPPTCCIHIFVTFASSCLRQAARSSKIILEAAHLVYRKFWGTSLDDILQHIPGSNLNYLPEDLINTLGLDVLLYHDTFLLVRKEYEATYREISRYKENPMSGGVVITGQPGIGKSCFLYFLLFRLLNERQPVAFQVNSGFILFQSTGVQLFDITSLYGQSIPPGTWALSDSHTHFERPCSAFLTARTTAWIVQTTSPEEERWKSWHNECFAEMYWMDVFSLDEVNALGTLCQFDLNRLRENYGLWGPSMRACMLSMDPAPHGLASHTFSQRYGLSAVRPMTRWGGIEIDEACRPYVRNVGATVVHSDVVYDI